MPDLESRVSNISSQHSALTRHLRDGLTHLVKTGEFPHLRNPKTRGSFSTVSSIPRIRPTTIVKPYGIPKTGKRNVEIGYSEALVVIQAQLRDPMNFQSGILPT